MAESSKPTPLSSTQAALKRQAELMAHAQQERAIAQSMGLIAPNGTSFPPMKNKSKIKKELSDLNDAVHYGNTEMAQNKIKAIQKLLGAVA
jgi:hypothetical protein